MSIPKPASHQTTLHVGLVAASICTVLVLGCSSRPQQDDDATATDDDSMDDDDVTDDDTSDDDDDDDDTTVGTWLINEADVFWSSTEPGELSGWTVVIGGDIDGDGSDDVLIGTFAGVSDPGKVYIQYGPAPASGWLDDADAILLGVADGDCAGAALSEPGDVDGDGLQDILVGAHGCSGQEPGRAYLIYGVLQGEVSLGSSDVTFHGVGDFDNAGRTVTIAGDLNADGYDDVVIGAPDGNLNGDYPGSEGKVYVIYGPVAPGQTSLASSDATLISDSWDLYAGWAVSTAGDVDADGNDDLLIGAPYPRLGALDLPGRAYLFYGPVYDTIQMSDAPAVMVGVYPNDSAGWAVSIAPDTDGDGFGDVVIGTRDHDNPGAVYLVRGPIYGEIELSNADAIIQGYFDCDGMGSGLSVGGDVNGDGLSDLLIGAPGCGELLDYPSERGIVSLFLGPLSGTHDLLDAPLVLLGDHELDRTGHGVSIAGDVDGDGLDDILIGAPFNMFEGHKTGRSYLIYSEGNR